MLRLRYATRSLRSTALTRAMSPLLTPARGFMTHAEFQEHVPPHLQAAYTAAMAGAAEPTTQRVGVGECHFVASTVGKLVQNRLDATARPSRVAKRVAAYQRWSARNEQAVRMGYTAVVRGHGAETPDSEWAGHTASTGHAVAVLGPTTDGNNFVVHDPDTTHDPRVAGSTSPGANLRVMSSQQLSSVRQVTQGDPHSADGASSLPVVEQRAPGFFSKALGFLGFGN